MRRIILGVLLVAAIGGAVIGMTFVTGASQADSMAASAGTSLSYEEHLLGLAVNVADEYGETHPTSIVWVSGLQRANAVWI